MLRGAVMTEVVFTLPGLGMMITGAVQTREYLVVQAGIMITGPWWCAQVMSRPWVPDGAAGRGRCP